MVYPNILKIDTDIRKLQNTIQKYFNELPEPNKNENIIINSEIVENDSPIDKDAIMTSDNVIIS